MKIFSILTCVLATWAAVAVNAQSPENAPSPSPSLPSPAPSNCLTIMMDMMPCLNFLEAGSDLTMPGASCCSGFKQVLNADPDCICVALAKSASFGIIVNMTQAATLPSDCGVSAPPLSNCNSTTPPSASPDNPPSPANPPSPVNPPTEQPAASPTSESPATVPTVDDEAPVEAPIAESSDSINLTASFLMLLVITAASLAFSIIMVA